MIFRSLSVLCIVAGSVIALEHRSQMTLPVIAPAPAPATMQPLDVAPQGGKTDRETAARVGKLVKVTSIFTPESPSFDAAFKASWQPTIAAKPDAKPEPASGQPILASLPPPREELPDDKPKAKPTRHRTEVAQDHLSRYCARPGKDRYSWIKVKGVKKFCPA